MNWYCNRDSYIEKINQLGLQVLHAARPTRWTFWGICITPSLYHVLPCINFQMSCEPDYTIGTWLYLLCEPCPVAWSSRVAESMLQCLTHGTRVVLVTSSHLCVRGMWLIRHIYICYTPWRTEALNLFLFVVTLLRSCTKLATRVWPCAGLRLVINNCYKTAFTSTTRKLSHCILSTARPGYGIQHKWLDPEKSILKSPLRINCILGLYISKRKYNQ